MATKNPMLSGKSTPGSVNAPGYGVNQDRPTTTRYKTPFQWSYPHLQTARFAEVKPVFVMDCVPNDDVKVYRDSVENSYTLNAPLLNPITKKYEYFAVPKQAILHNTWTKLFVNPKKGDDVVPDDVNCLINPTDFASMFTGLPELTTSSGDALISAVFRAMVMYIDIFGPDSLPGKLKIPFVTPVATGSRAVGSDGGSYPLWNIKSGSTAGNNSLWQAFFSAFSEVNPLEVQIGVGSGSVTLSFDLSKPTGLYSFMHFVALMRESYVDVSFVRDDDTGFSTFIDVVNSQRSIFNASPYFYLDIANENLNIQRVVAYQLSCAQFITNDNVDDVFTSELYRQNQESLVYQALGNIPTFTWNGITILYDWCSAAVINQMIMKFGTSTELQKIAIINYFCNMFTIVNSLRFADMFNSCKTDPAAVGDTDIAISGPSLNTLEVVRNILKEKFLNLVNNVRNTVREYSLSVFGVAPDVVPEEPRRISVSEMQIKANVNVNTAENQGTQKSTLTGISQNMEFASHFNQDTIIIGVSWYTTVAAYNLVRTPFAYHYSRFDSYLPQLQNIGNVAVNKNLIQKPASIPAVYGYLPNDFEYKQDFGSAEGAFLVEGQLPGWSYSRLMNGADSVLSPYSIRHHDFEFDQFFVSLAGVFADYFHFIESDFFTVVASRPMEYVPGILMNS